MHPTVVAAARDLHVARQRFAAAKERVDYIERTAKENYKADYQEFADAKVAVGKAEDFLRVFAEQMYLSTADAEPAPGVTVKRVIVFEYNDDDALKFAKDSGLILTFDRERLEKLLKASPTSFPFVKTRTEPKASVAKDLSAAALAFSEARPDVSTTTPAITQEPDLTTATETEDDRTPF